MQPLFDVRHQLGDEDFHREFVRRVFAAHAPVRGTVAHPQPRPRNSAGFRLQAPPWDAPLQIVPGVPTLVLTGGWEPLYEEIAVT